MIIYIDENMPKHLADGFHLLQYPEGLKTGNEIEVKYIPTEFNVGVKDPEWIPVAGKQGACIITQDVNISRRKHEIALYKEYKLGLFFLRGESKKKGLSIWQMVEAMAKNWPEISKKVYSEKKPFAYQFSIKGKMRKLPQ